MKKLLLLLLAVSFSLTAQEKQQTNPLKVAQDTTVTLSTRVAKEVVKDLIAKDYCEKQVSAQKELITQLEQKIELKDTIISSFSRTDKLNEKIQLSQEKQITALEKDLKKVNRKNTFTKILLYSSLIFSGYLLITK